MDWTNTLEEWRAYGMLCRIKPGFASLNGYVQIPEGLPLGVETAHAVLSAHGAITYGPDADRWVGFHTSHGCDHWAPDDLIGRVPDGGLMAAASVRDMAMALGDGRRWTYDELHAETEQLAQQIAVALDLAT